MSDNINPSHYKRLPAEAIEIIEAMITGAPDNKAAYLHGQAAKYDLRLWGKGKSLEDFLSDWGKHIWYALRLESHLLELIEKQKADEQQKAADLQSLKDHPFGKLKESTLNSDTIPKGYRKLGDSSIEARQLGDLRWSVAKKRYVEITVDEIGHANRDNWAACRKIEPAIKQSLTTDPPDGWRWLEVGEILRRLDASFNSDGSLYELNQEKAGRTVTAPNIFIRRNRFEVGEKVVRVLNGVVYKVVRILSMGYQLESEFCAEVILHGKDLAPYIEDAK